MQLLIKICPKYWELFWLSGTSLIISSYHNYWKTSRLSRLFQELLWGKFWGLLAWIFIEKGCEYIATVSSRDITRSHGFKFHVCGPVNKRVRALATFIEARYGTKNPNHSGDELFACAISSTSTAKRKRAAPIFFFKSALLPTQAL